MPLALLAFLRSPLARYVLAALAFVAFVVGVELHGRHAQAKHDAPMITDPGTHKAWKAEALSAILDLGTCRTNTASLEASLDRQSAAVTALAQESATRVAQSVKAASDARAVADRFRRSAASILGAKPGADKCQSADALIAEAVG